MMLHFRGQLALCVDGPVARGCGWCLGCVVGNLAVSCGSRAVSCGNRAVSCGNRAVSCGNRAVSCGNRAVVRGTSSLATKCLVQLQATRTTSGLNKASKPGFKIS